MLQVQSLFLGHPCCSKPSNILHVQKIAVLAPLPWYDLVVRILLVTVCILQSRVAHPHQVVETATCDDNLVDGLWGRSHGGHDALPSVCQNSKGVFYYSSGSGEEVIEDPFFVGQISLAEGLHQPCFQGKSIITNDEKWCVLVISGEWSGIWSTRCTSHKGLFQLRVVEQLAIGSRTVGPYTDPEKCVVSIH